MNLQEKVNTFIASQKADWPLMGTNHAQLRSVEIRNIRIDGSEFRLQFNPERIRSSGARVDKASIEARPCFLCAGNRPPEQDSIALDNGYEILCNPFPIFDRHLTVARKEHVPQQIADEFDALLEISALLPDFVHFYNGPKCGASAPDHMHFQAGNRGLMPLEDEYTAPGYRFRTGLFGKGRSTVSAMDDGLRRFFLLESEDRDFLNDVFSSLYNLAGNGLKETGEPMMNILAYYRTKWSVLIFLREAHRPRQYFSEGDDNILLSPASVDMGGTLIVPLEKDFRKISSEDIRNIFGQVILPADRFCDIYNALRERYA